MRIRLTEAQAWETLARFFGGRTGGFIGAAGLCWQTERLWLEGWITRGIFYRILDSIETDTDPFALGFFWPRTRAGARARARFCWRQVKRLKGW